MINEVKNLLIRWKSLEEGDGIQKAHSTVRLLQVVGFALFIFVIVGVVYKLPPITIVIAALFAGWIIAERNALQNRLLQWPMLRQYIDWKKVNEDLNEDSKSAEQGAAANP